MCNRHLYPTERIESPHLHSVCSFCSKTFSGPGVVLRAKMEQADGLLTFTYHPMCEYMLLRDTQHKTIPFQGDATIRGLECEAYGTPLQSSVRYPETHQVDNLLTRNEGHYAGLYTSKDKVVPASATMLGMRTYHVSLPDLGIRRPVLSGVTEGIEPKMNMDYLRTRMHAIGGFKPDAQVRISPPSTPGIAPLFDAWLKAVENFPATSRFHGRG